MTSNRFSRRLLLPLPVRSIRSIDSMRDWLPGVLAPWLLGEEGQVYGDTAADERDRIDTGATVDAGELAVGYTEDRGGEVACVEHEAVIAGTAVEHVGAAVANQHVVAGVADQSFAGGGAGGVVAGAAELVNGGGTRKRRWCRRKSHSCARLRCRQRGRRMGRR